MSTKLPIPSPGAAIQAILRTGNQQRPRRDDKISDGRIAAYMAAGLNSQTKDISSTYLESKSLTIATTDANLLDHVVLVVGGSSELPTKQGTPVRFRDGPAAVTEIDEDGLSVAIVVADTTRER